MLKYALLLVLLTGLVAVSFKKITTPARIPANGFAVVELFTSQGCSSCPAADQLLQKLQRESADAPVYLLAYHVDYWDHLGWKDPFSQAQFSQRQRQYARWLGQGNVYTPQMVVNGEQEFVGSNEKTLRTALNRALAQNAPARLSLKWAPDTNNQLRVEYTVTGDLKGSKLMLALVQPQAQTTVRRGENQGRRLNHVNIVRDIITVPVNAADKTGWVPLALPTALENQSWELVGFLQQPATGKILAAAPLKR